MTDIRWTGIDDYFIDLDLWRRANDAIFVDEAGEITDEQWSYLLRRIRVKTDDELRKEYTYQRPTEAARVLHEEVNSRLLDLAIWVEHNLPEGRDKSLFHTKLEEARMWANKSIAMNHDKL